MTPEQTAADIIRRVAGADGSLRGATPEQIGRTSVEHMSLAGLLIVPVARLSALLAVERAARALAASDDAMNVALAGVPMDPMLVDPWPEADALVAALIEVAA